MYITISHTEATTSGNKEVEYDEKEAEKLANTTIDPNWWRFVDDSSGGGSGGGNSGVGGGGSSTSAATNTGTSTDNPTTTTISDSSQLLLPTDLSLLQLSNKMVTLLTLLMLSVIEGDKMLVFSQSLFSLDCIELFLNMMHWDRLLTHNSSSASASGDTSNTNNTNTAYAARYNFSHWRREHEYLRIDGSSSNRQKTIDRFNARPQHKLMLISTKAGNMGINLQAANRVVIFDTSWNPVHDLQAMYRAYR